MNRREFITLSAAVAAWPVAAWDSTRQRSLANRGASRALDKSISAAACSYDLFSPQRPTTKTALICSPSTRGGQKCQSSV